MSEKLPNSPWNEIVLVLTSPQGLVAIFILLEVFQLVRR